MEQVRICPVCGKEFFPKTNKKYCCPKCARKAETQKSIVNIRARSKIKSKQNPYLLYAYDFKCAICHWEIPQDFSVATYSPQHGCEFHHIIPVSEGGENTEKNLILLCPNCHKLAHSGVLSRQELQKHTFTKEECIQARLRWALDSGVGTYWVDNIFLNKAGFRQKLAAGEEI